MHSSYFKLMATTIGLLVRNRRERTHTGRQTISHHSRAKVAMTLGRPLSRQSMVSVLIHVKKGMHVVIARKPINGLCG